MAAIKEYLLSVTSAALICGAVYSLCGKSATTARLMKLLCGLFLAVTVIKPLTDVKLDNVYTFTDNLSADSERAVSLGKELAADEMKRIIKEKAEAYILDKAKSLGAEIQVEIVLKDLTPVTAIVTGSISPFTRSSLSECIFDDLGIPAEEQIWKRS